MPATHRILPGKNKIAMKAFTKEEVREKLSDTLKEWTFDGSFISREYSFSDFKEAFSFMTSVALTAEKKDHHPDWTNVYNRVTIKLQTHSAGGITQNDIDLAIAADTFFNRYLVP